MDASRGGGGAGTGAYLCDDGNDARRRLVYASRTALSARALSIQAPRVREELLNVGPDAGKDALRYRTTGLRLLGRSGGRMFPFCTRGGLLSRALWWSSQTTRACDGRKNAVSVVPLPARMR